jgi:hypothetical protein
VAGHPSYGLPWGQDRLVPIFLATLAVRQQNRTVTFTSAADMLETFGMQQGGSQYRRLVAAFQRIFGATIFFGTDTQSVRANVFHHARFNFMSEAQIWCSRLPTDEPPPGKVENVIVLSQEFYKEIVDHPIPTDLEAAKALSSAPAALDLYTWLTYRCFSAKGEERVPLFGEFGLVNQLGIGAYARPRKFREQLEQWLIPIKAMWPECPARVSSDGGALVISSAYAILSTRTLGSQGEGIFEKKSIGWMGPDFCGSHAAETRSVTETVKSSRAWPHHWKPASTRIPSR